ncbi:hypothetical protein HOK51_11100 [Candidatus Woesearchaeota archaeon]|jgi:chromosome segregation ATPase|nr:hypothetical protein [Candidatus Woesearchaeota archaeon]MBT6520369.1 hypothetical protein [Candidatus Woesearchaeota archaeon]MBT7368549.1 hypothetical protein [Candidatus Woesearchaeota archaeon]
MDEKNEVQLDSIESNLLAELEKKSSELSQNNSFLAEKLKETECTISSFNTELAKLKNVKDALTQKDIIITKLNKKIEIMSYAQKQLEFDALDLNEQVTKKSESLDFSESKLVERNKIIEDLKSKISILSFAQKQLESEVLDIKSQLDKSVANLEFNKDEIVNKELEVTELSGQIKHQSDAINRLESESAHFRNHVELLTSKLHIKEEDFNKFADDLAESRKKVALLNTTLIKKSQEFEAKETNLTQTLNQTKENQEVYVKRLISQYTLKIISLKNQMEKMDKLISIKNGTIQNQKVKANNIMSDLNSRFKDLMSSEDAATLNGFESEITSSDSNDFEYELDSDSINSSDVKEDSIPAANLDTNSSSFDSFKQELVYEDQSEEAAVEEEELLVDPYQEIQDPYSSAPMPNIDDIVPMIQIAIQHGDQEMSIVKSLTNSGIPKKAVDLAFEKIRQE